MKSRSRWCAVLPALAYLLTSAAVDHAQAPNSPIRPTEAVRVLEEWLRQSHYYYSLDAQCITVGEPTYVNRGYTIALRGPHARGCPSRPEERGIGNTDLGRWRVDAFTREVFVQDLGGRFFPPRLSRPPSEASRRGAPIPPGYRLNATIPLERKFAGMDGSVELLEDERIAPPWDMIDYIPGNGSCEFVASTPDKRALCESLSSLRQPVLRLVDIAGGEVSRLLLGGSLLRDVSVEHLYASERPTYFVTEDPVCRVSSYCGPHTYLTEVRNGRLARIEAENRKAHQIEPFDLLSSQKHQWQVIHSSKGGYDVFEAWSEPNSDVFGKQEPALDRDFDSVYVRYSFEGGRWVSYERREPGYMEFSQERRFPPLSKFP